MIPSLAFFLAVGQAACIAIGSDIPAPPRDKPDHCPDGMVAIGAGVWVAQGMLDRQAHILSLSAGPWQTAGEQCEQCPRSLPTTCVADYQGMQLVRTATGQTKLHVFGQTHWLPARRTLGR